ncbi:MAG TPA: hypothetical protein VIO61_04975 [Anaerolineaceae bacterium]
MATVEERMRILRLIEEGKISAEEGVQLLEALGDRSNAAKAPPRQPGYWKHFTPPAPPTPPSRPTPPTKPSPPTAPEIPAGLRGRWFRVVVTDTNTGKARVNVRLPLGLVNAGLKMGARFAPQVEGLDENILREFILSGETGKVVDVTDEDDGEHVEVYIE